MNKSIQIADGIFKNRKVRIFVLLAVLFLVLFWFFKALLPGSAGEYQVIEIQSQGRTLFLRSLNDNGQATGFVRRGQGKEHAMIWDADTGVTTLSTPEGYSSIGMDINNSGEVCGEARDPNNRPRACFWDSEGQIIVTARKSSSYRWYLMTPANMFPAED